MLRLNKAKKRKMIITVCSILICLIGFCFAVITSLKVLDSRYQARIERLNEEIIGITRTVYVANGPIYAGTPIMEGNILKSSTYSSNPEEFFITTEDIGKIATVDIYDGQAILKQMVGNDLQRGLREQEYTCLRLNSNLKENDFVDIRIMFPNGENKTVVPKKALKNLDLESNTCFLWLNEEEITRMSSAIVDTYIHSGSIMYVARYIEDSQEASIATYEPSYDVMMEMSNNPNIIQEAAKELNLKARRELDARLKTFKSDEEVDLTQINQPSGNINKNTSNNDETGDNSSESGISDLVLPGETQQSSDNLEDEEGGEEYDQN